MTPPDQRPVVLMQPGPLHLFWTTGVFYLWALRDRFDVALSVPESYRASADFRRIAALPFVRAVEFLPQGRPLARHRACVRQLRKLLADTRPCCLLLHNTCYVENLYLVRLARARQPGLPVHHFQNARLAVLWSNDFGIRRAVQVERLSRRFPALARWPRLAGWLVDRLNGLRFAAEYTVAPRLVTGRALRPPLNVFDGRPSPSRGRDAGPHDRLFCYLECEAAIWRGLGLGAPRLIRHPLAACGEAVFRFLDARFEQRTQIVIRPSHGFTAVLKARGWQEGAVIDHLARRWGDAIDKLGQSYAGHALKFKPHPASRDDPVWASVLERLARRFPALEQVPATEAAEPLIAQSRVVVGDVTTALWWAGLHGGKIVISLDIFGFEGGDEMRAYAPLVHVVDDLDAPWPVEAAPAPAIADTVLDHLP